jgi:hypothetical protein
LKSLNTNPHVQAVKSLASIVGTRRHKERAQQNRKLFFCQNTSRAAHARAPNAAEQLIVPQPANSKFKRKKQLTAPQPRHRKKT